MQTQSSTLAAHACGPPNFLLTLDRMLEASQAKELPQDVPPDNRTLGVLLGVALLVGCTYVTCRVHRRLMFEPVPVRDIAFQVIDNGRSAGLEGQFTYIWNGAEHSSAWFTEFSDFLSSTSAKLAAASAAHATIGYRDPFSGQAILSRQFYAHDLFFASMTLCPLCFAWVLLVGAARFAHTPPKALQPQMLIVVMVTFGVGIFTAAILTRVESPARFMPLCFGLAAAYLITAWAATIITFGRFVRNTVGHLRA
jgi:hypothetical protein